ncbi:MAG TPA: hypothetical protein VIL45_07085 [Thermoplasmata archaeon]
MPTMTMRNRVATHPDRLFLLRELSHYARSARASLRTMDRAIRSGSRAAWWSDSTYLSFARTREDRIARSRRMGRAFAELQTRGIGPNREYLPLDDSAVVEAIDSALRAHRAEMRIRAELGAMGA